jgi:hypothetical protein
MAQASKPLLSALFFCLASIFAACGVGRGPAVHVLICVENESGMTTLRGILKKAARDAGLGFIDYSKNRPDELKAVGAPLDHLNSESDYFEVWGDGGTGAGFSASNLGLSSFEVSIGFGGGGEGQLEAKDLARRVVTELSKHWVVALVPPDRGALPTGRCPTPTDAPSNTSLERTREG